MNIERKTMIEDKLTLQFITNQWSEKSIVEQTEEACKGGCRWIQLRLKDVPRKKFIEIAKDVKHVCSKYKAVLIINDNVEITLKVDADGVHLGKEDMDPGKARELLGENKIIGGTTNTFDDVLSTYEKGVDYIGLGPYRETPTKLNLSPVLGLDSYKKIIKKLEEKNIHIPIVAIGGIQEDDISLLFNAGLQGIAISSMIANHKDSEQITRNVLKKINVPC